jgi:voltage-gated potassium channel
LTNPTDLTVRDKVHEVIFGADTPAGKAFDIALLVLIVVSIVAVMVESLPTLDEKWRGVLTLVEAGITLIFSVEYLLRLYCVKRPLRYAFSFYGVIDLMAIAPFFVGLFFGGAQSLTVVRVLRLLRVFRILKLTHFVGEAKMLRSALRASSRKIIVFLGVVLTLVVIIGAVMYLVEGGENGFVSIPHAIYWAIVTLTTVGYGDIAPQTPLGQLLASMVMIVGYGIIAVPTGIVTVELSRASAPARSTQSCPSCSVEGHDADALHCKFCGARL